MQSNAPATPPPAKRSANASGRALVRNVAVSYLNLARATVIGLVVTPILLRALHQESFGVWSLLLGVTGYVSLVDSGISTAMVAQISSAQARREPQRVVEVVRSGQRLLYLLTMAGTIVLAAALIVFNKIFDVPLALEGSSRVALLLLGASTLVTVASTSWTAALVGIGRVDVSSTISFAITSILAILQLLLALSGAGLVGLAAASLFAAIVSTIMVRIVTRRHLPDLRDGVPSTATARSLLRLGGQNLLVTATTLMAFGSDVIIAGAVAGTIAAAAYAVAARAANFAKSIASSAGDVLAPAFGHASALGDGQRIRVLYQTSVMVSMMIAIPISVILGALSEPLLQLWVGKPPPGSPAILTTLAALIVAQIPGSIGFVYFMGTQNSGRLLRYSAPSAVLNLCLSIGLTFVFGAVGPALGTLLATALIDPLIIRHIAHGALQMRLRTLATPLASALGLPTVITLAAVVLTRPLAKTTPALAVALAAGAGAVFFLSTVAWLRWSKRGELLRPALTVLPRGGAMMSRLLAVPIATD